jgi:hypothetical protein
MSGKFNSQIINSPKLRAIVGLPATSNIGLPRQAALRTAELTFVPRKPSQQIGLARVIDNAGGLLRTTLAMAGAELPQTTGCAIREKLEYFCYRGQKFG